MESQTDNSVQNKKKKYQTPKLVEFGALHELTQGRVGSQAERTGGMFVAQ